MIFNATNILVSSEHISKAWPEAIILNNNNNSANFINYLTLPDNIFNMLILISVICFFAFFYSRILEGIKHIWLSFFSLKETIWLESDPNIQTCRNSFLTFGTLLYILLTVNLLPLRFFFFESSHICINMLTLGLFLILFIIIKKMSMQILSWINSNDCFILLYKISLSSLSFGILIWLSSLLLLSIIPNTSIYWFYVAFYICLIISVLVYLIRTYQIIISNGFSHFFWIVYLCSLEVIPLLSVTCLFSMS